MGAKSFIVRGLGNKESFCSCSHGAGRVMSLYQRRLRVHHRLNVFISQRNFVDHLTIFSAFDMGASMPRCASACGGS
jgi:hypothetical protein